MTHDPCDIVLVTFGPIQPFIAASRRTQDLAVSSQILSSLANAGLNYISTDTNLTPIFPVPGGEESGKCLPNRLVFLVPKGQGEEHAKEIEKQIRKQWEKIANSVKSHLLKMTSHSEWATKWDAQAEKWLEIYWVSTAWDGQDSTYSKSFRTLNMAIDARKNLRHYPSADQPGKKGDLIGTLSAIGTTQDYNIWPEIRSQVGRTQLRENENLSAIGAIKRFADQAKAPGIDLGRFPSTSSIAVASFRQQVLQHWEITAPAAKKFIKAVSDLKLMTFTEMEPFPILQDLTKNDGQKEMLLRLEGDYFFRDFYTLENVNDSRKGNIPPLEGTTETIKATRTALSGLLEKMAEVSRKVKGTIPSPNTYLAALVMDGDHMGHLIDETEFLDEHIDISQTMANTAKEFRGIIEKDSPGILVYSGGDDVLALLPVSCVLEVAQNVREAFIKNMRKFNPEADMSGGIAIMHHQAPLEALLQRARKAEYQAKEVHNRGSLVITVIKRSGEDISAAMKWPSSTDKNNPINDLISYLSTGWISTKFVFDLRSETAALIENSEGFEWEVKRLIKRHMDQKAKIDVDTFKSRLAKFTGQMPYSLDPFLGLMDWMMIARFIAKGERS